MNATVPHSGVSQEVVGLDVQNIILVSLNQRAREDAIINNPNPLKAVGSDDIVGNVKSKIDIGSASEGDKSSGEKHERKGKTEHLGGQVCSMSIGESNSPSLYTSEGTPGPRLWRTNSHGIA